MKKLSFSVVCAVFAVMCLTGCDHHDVNKDDPDTINGSDPEAIKKWANFARQREHDTYKAARADMAKTHHAIVKQENHDVGHGTWSNYDGNGTFTPVLPPPTTITVPSVPPVVVVTAPPVTPLPDAPPVITTPVAPPAVTPPVVLPPGTRNQRALLVGINKYPGAALNGCVDDATDIRTLLTTGRIAMDDGTTTTVTLPCPYFLDTEIRFLTDEQATTANIQAGLDWLAEGAGPGTYRWFWYSGHGAEYAGSDVSTQPDGQNQVICPVDFDWSETHMILDVQFKAKFSTMGKGVLFFWGSDSCHSGDLSRLIPKAKARYRQYPLTTAPANVLTQLAKAHKIKGVRRDLVNGSVEVGYLSGCKYDEFSADTQDVRGRPCGADTHYFLQALGVKGAIDLPLSTLAGQLNTTLDSMQYGQHPQAEGANKDRPILK